MCYMCAERNKLRRVFSTAIDLVKAPCNEINYVINIADNLSGNNLNPTSCGGDLELAVKNLYARYL